MKFYRMWVIIRLTGCWPLTCIGGDTLPLSLSACNLCGLRNVRVSHALCECQGTAGFRTQLLVPDPVFFMRQALDDGGDEADLRNKIGFVGKCVSATLAGQLAAEL